MIIYFCKRPLRVFGKKVGGFSAGSFSGLCVLQLLWRMPHAQANNMLTGIALPSTRCLVIRAHSSCNFLYESWFPPFSYSAIAIIVAQDLLSVPSLNTHLLSSRLWEGAKVPSNFPNLAYHLEIGSNFKSVELSSTFLAGVKGLAHVQWLLASILIMRPKAHHASSKKQVAETLQAMLLGVLYFRCNSPSSKEPSILQTQRNERIIAVTKFRNQKCHRRHKINFL